MHMHQSHGYATLYGRIIHFLANFDETAHFTPLMTFDPNEKKYTYTQAKCIVPV